MITVMFSSNGENIFFQRNCMYEIKGSLIFHRKYTKHYCKTNYKHPTLVDSLKLLHLLGGSTRTLQCSGRAHPLAGFNGRLFVSIPQGCPPPLQRRFHCILTLAAAGLIRLLPWEYGRSSLASSNVLVAYTG